MSRCSFEVQLAEAALESLLALIGPLLQPRDLGPAFADLRFGLVAPPCRLLLRGEEHRLGFLLGGADLLETAFSISVVRDAALRDASARIHESGSRKHGRNNHQPYQGDDLDADGMEPRRSGASAPCLECLYVGEGDRGETHNVSMIRSGPARDLAGRSRRKTIPIVRAKGLTSHVSMNATAAGYP